MEHKITFSGLFSYFPEAIIIVDNKDLIKKSNPKVDKLFGYAGTELEGLHLSTVISIENTGDQSQYISDIFTERIVDQNNNKQNFYGIRKDKTKFPLAVEIGELDNNTVKLKIVTLKDISKRREDEQKLKSSELQYKNLILNHPHGIIETLFNGTITIVNRAYTNLYDLDFDKIVGKKAWEITDDHQSVKLIHDFFTKVRNGDLVPDTRIEERKTIDGNTIQIQIDWNYKFDVDGNKIGITTFVTDVTKYRRIVEELKISEERLRALSTRLQSKIEDERRKLAREIHDELGQVLTAINMEVDLIIDELEEIFDPPPEKTVLNLKSLGELIDRLILSVQTISAELRPDILDHLGLYAAMEWQLKEFEKLYKIRTVINNFDQELELSDEKSISIFRIFQESLTNIARHSKATQVWVNFKFEDNLINISIIDNGIGIDKNILEDIKSLGIMGIKERVYILGGNITFENVKEGGTGVYLRVPLID